MGKTQISLRVDDDLLDAIETARGRVPRETWIRDLIAREVWPQKQAVGSLGRGSASPSLRRFGGSS